MTMQQYDGIKQDEDGMWRVKRLPRAYGRKRVGGRFDTTEKAIRARETAMRIQGNGYVADARRLADDIFDELFVQGHDQPARHTLNPTGLMPPPLPVPITETETDNDGGVRVGYAWHDGKSYTDYSGRYTGFVTPEEHAQNLEWMQRKQNMVRVDIPVVPANVDLIEAQPLTLHMDTWLYASDLHAPLHNREYVKRLMLVARKHGVQHLVIGGDFFDFASSGNHPKTEQQASLNQTLRVGGDVLSSLCDVFASVVILPGNHCLRVAKRLAEPLDFDMLVHAALRGRNSGQVTTTNYDYVYVNDDWVVGHPRFFEGSAAGGLSRAAIRENRNVIGSHTHALSLSYTPDGRHMVIYPGHMSDASLTPYIMQSRGLSRFAEWRNGFVMVDAGVMSLFADGLVNWQEYR